MDDYIIAYCTVVVYFNPRIDYRPCTNTHLVAQVTLGMYLTVVSNHCIFSNIAECPYEYIRTYFGGWMNENGLLYAFQLGGLHLLVGFHQAGES